MFDLSIFAEAAVGGVPLLFVVLGLVQWIKETAGELPAWAVRVVSMAVGLIFGGAYMISTAGVPQDFAAGFAVSVYGIALGLIASGVYDVGAELAEKFNK